MTTRTPTGRHGTGSPGAGTGHIDVGASTATRSSALTAPTDSRRGALLRAITPLGWGVLAAIPVLAVLGVVTGWWEWLGMAAGLLVIAVVAVVATLGTFAFAMSMRISDHRLVVGEPGEVAVRVRNSSRRRILPARVELVVTEHTYAVNLPSLPPGGVHDVLLPVPTDRRAVLTLGPVRAVRADPLGLIRRVVSWPFGQKVYVVPRTVRTDGSLAGFIRDLEGEESPVRTSSDLAFHALRDYVPGDDRRHIHWKKTARAGSLLVREFLETHRSVVVLVLSTDPREYATPEEFELAVSAAASVMSDLVRMQRMVTTTAHGTQIRGVSAGGVLEQFAEIAADEAGSLLPTVRTALRRHPQVSLLVPVFGSLVSDATMRAAYRLRPPGSVALGLRADLAGHGLGWHTPQTLTVPELELLPKLLREARR